MTTNQLVYFIIKNPRSSRDSAQFSDIISVAGMPTDEELGKMREYITGRGRSVYGPYLDKKDMRRELRKQTLASLKEYVPYVAEALESPGGTTRPFIAMLENKPNSNLLKYEGYHSISHHELDDLTKLFCVYIVTPQDDLTAIYSVQHIPIVTDLEPVRETSFRAILHNRYITDKNRYDITDAAQSKILSWGRCCARALRIATKTTQDDSAERLATDNKLSKEDADALINFYKDHNLGEKKTFSVPNVFRFIMKDANGKELCELEFN